MFATRAIGAFVGTTRTTRTFPAFDVPCVVMHPGPDREENCFGDEDLLYVGGVMDLARQVEEQHASRLRELADMERDWLLEEQQAKNHEEWVRRAWRDFLHQDVTTPEQPTSDEVEAVEVDHFDQLDLCSSLATCSTPVAKFATKLVKLGKPGEPEVCPTVYPRIVVPAKSKVKKATRTQSSTPSATPKTPRTPRTPRKHPLMRPTFRKNVRMGIANEPLRAATWIARFAPRVNRQCLCDLAHISMRTLRRYVQFSCCEEARNYNIFFGRSGKTKLKLLDRTAAFRRVKQLSVHPQFNQFLVGGPELAHEMYRAMVNKHFACK